MSKFVRAKIKDGGGAYPVQQEGEEGNLAEGSGGELRLKYASVYDPAGEDGHAEDVHSYPSDNFQRAGRDIRKRK